MLKRAGRGGKALAVALLAGACAMLGALPAFDRLSGLDIDLLHGLSALILPQPAADPGLQHSVVVAIDEATHVSPSFAGLPKVMWTPQIARVQDAILAATPSAIGWDLILPTSAAAYVADRGFDKPLLASLAGAARSNRIVLGTAQLGDNLISPHRLFSYSAGGGRNMRSLNIAVEPDGVVRRVPLFFRRADGDAYVPSMALELAARRKGSEPARTPDGGVAFGGQRVPATAADGVLLNFQGAGGIVPTFSLADLHACAEAGNDGFFQEHFAGKTVLLGLVLDIEDRKLASNRLVTDGGPLGPRIRCSGGASVARDGVRTSTIPGVYLHAMAVNNLLNGDGLRQPSRPWRALAAAPLPAFVGAATMTFGPALAAAAAVLGALALIAVAVAAFGSTLVLPLIVPLVFALAVFVAVLGYRFIYSDRQQRFLRKAFASYVSPDLVEALVANPEQLRLGGERRNMSFLFTDIAGFTSLVEDLDPAEVGSLLNRYLDEMISVAKRHGGTIDKVIGDAVVVIFSAPVELSDHAERAIACALAMDAASEAFASSRRAEGMKFGVTRIGVHSGAAVIGNFGGKDFFDYTAIGDAMNTAARLESANKQFGTRIAVSGVAVDRCASFTGRPIGQVIFKGKSRPIAVHEPLSPEEEASPRIEAYRQAYALLESESPDAARAFEELAARYPDDGLAAMHRARLRAGRNGVTITLEEK
ncbi:MAG: adenylate/guanylate cyclase domain-containing protein [Hyphomicrobiales bacterium]